MAMTVQKTGELVPEETITSIVEAIAKAFSPHKIVLFGSYASGDQTSDSDLDLLIIMQTDLPWHRRAIPVHLLFRPTPCAMDILVFTPEEVSYWNGVPNHILTEALSSGKIVYERKAA